MFSRIKSKVYFKKFSLQKAEKGGFHMNLFDMFGLDGVEAPVTTEKKETKKEAKKGTDNKSSKSKEVKNMLKLPANAYILMHGVVQLTKEILGIEEDTISNNQVEDFLKANYRICNILSFNYDKNRVVATASLISEKSITIEDGDVFLFDGNEYNLSDIVGEISSLDLKNELTENMGVSLPDGTGFCRKDGIILPVLTPVTDKDIKENLLSPVTVKFYGTEPFTVSTEKAIDSKIIVDEVIKIYPDLSGNIKLVGINAAENSIGVIVSNNSTNSNAKAEVKYVVTEKTVIKFYSNELPTIEPGKYTHKELCKALAAAAPECHTPDSIIIKEMKKDNLIVLGVKFGGTKG